MCRTPPAGEIALPPVITETDRTLQIRPRSPASSLIGRRRAGGEMGLGEGLWRSLSTPPLPRNADFQTSSSSVGGANDRRHCQGLFDSEATEEEVESRSKRGETGIMLSARSHLAVLGAPGMRLGRRQPIRSSSSAKAGTQAAGGRGQGKE